MKIFLLLLFGQVLLGQSPFYLGQDGGVYRGDLRRIGLGVGSSLAVHGQTAYLVGTDGRVWTSEAEREWRPLPTLATGHKVVVDASGSPLLLGTDGGVYRLGGRRVERLGLATALDVDVAEDGGVYIVGVDNRLWLLPAGSSQWQLFNPFATARKVAAGAGSVYCIGTDGGVYRVGPRGVDRLGLATAAEISAGTAGQLAIVGLDGGVYFLRGDRWERQGTGTARGVAWPK
jgi:hypothetical protein